jgi:polysaccharide deacetylase family protein (PEP-CTERM system associated)
MFVLGLVAEVFPDLVREIARRGHEIASHGYLHREIFLGGKEEFAEDISRSKRLLEEICGQPVIGYRAPDFSIIPSTLWALEVLADCGYRYDSSIFPVQHNRYGIPDWPESPVYVELGGEKRILELPIGTLVGKRKNWPLGGGGYQRLLPGGTYRRLVGKALRESPFVFYCHPYEIDHKEMRELTFPASLKLRLHQGLGRRWIAKRLRRLFTTFGGSPLSEALNDSGIPSCSLPLGTDKSCI